MHGHQGVDRSVYTPPYNHTHNHSNATQTHSHPLGAGFVEELKRRSPAVVLSPLPTSQADFEVSCVRSHA